MSQGPCWKQFTPLLVLGKKGRGGEKVLVTPYHQGIDCGQAGKGRGMCSGGTQVVPGAEGPGKVPPVKKAAEAQAQA